MSVDHDANETGAAAEPAWEGSGQPSEPEVVDFDALNAALGALPPPGAPSSPQLADSEGRSSATYASARPHPIPATRAPVELNAPAVIIAPEEPTVPSGPPVQMTVPLTPAGGIPAAPRTGPLPHGTPNNPYASDPYVAVAQQHPPSDNINVGHTVPMANPQRPRRPRTPTVVVRPRGPSKTKKLLVFIALLLVFVVGGTALLFFVKLPASFGFGPKAKPATTTPAVFPPAPPFPTTAVPAPAVSVAPAPSASASPATSSSAMSSASASARKPVPPRVHTP